MKYILLALFLVHAVHSAPSDLEKVEVEIEAAQWGCSSSCGCRQQCQIIWWMPCRCSPCPPSCGCCQQTPTTTTPEPTTTTQPVTEPQPPNGETPCNGGSCCNKCSCMPCMMPVIWMCPPRCGGGCCNSGGGSNCCNSSNRSCCGK